MLSRVASLGESLCRTTAPRGQTVVLREVEGLQEDWQAFSVAVSDVEANLEACISNWTQLDEEQQALMTWLERMDQKLKQCLENKASLARKRAQLQEGEVNCFVFLYFFISVLEKTRALEYLMICYS